MKIGPSEVCVTSSGIFLVLAPVVKIPEGVVVGFQNFAWAPNSQKPAICADGFKGGHP